jgi:hypothetical protein
MGQGVATFKKETRMAPSGNEIKPELFEMLQKKHSHEISVIFQTS